VREVGSTGYSLRPPSIPDQWGIFYARDSEVLETHLPIRVPEDTSFNDTSDSPGRIFKYRNQWRGIISQS